MVSVENPAIQAFTARIRDELPLGQVRIRRRPDGYELRHVADVASAPQALSALTLDELRRLAQFAARGDFRPLKSAPSLAGGWRFEARSDPELEQALNRLYPGAVADWFATQAPVPPVTPFRQFVGRQSGRYRITRMLTDEQAVTVTRTTCRPAACLKRRLWTVPCLEPDRPEDKSLIPCLEPCAVWLESAHVAMREAQAAEFSAPTSQSPGPDAHPAGPVSIAQPRGER
jgi:hypothetical protein